MAATMEMRYTVDLHAPLRMQEAGTLMVEGDNLANTIVLEVLADGSPAALDGCTATAYMIRADGDKPFVPCTVEGNVIRAVLSASFYTVPGRFDLFVRLTSQEDDTRRTLLWLNGWVKTEGSGDLVDSAEVVPTLDTLLAQIERLEAAVESAEAAVNMTIAFDPTAYDLPILYLTGDISPIRESKDNKVTVDYVYGDLSGTCTLKGQGATSYVMAQAKGDKGKFNYTIKFDQAFEAADGWGEQQKYCLKANVIDHTHSRNVVSAKLWGLMVKSRATENTNLSGLVNGGAVDGFPIIIMLNDKFHGLYTFNIPKDGWMMGMVEDATAQQAIVGANEHSKATQFKGLPVGDESDFEVEFVSDEDNADWVTTSLNTMIQSCIGSDGTDLDDVVGLYLDWDSVIDYCIWVAVVKGTDMVDKNYLLSTFDGVKWQFTAYDMDSTYGLSWTGSKLTQAFPKVNRISFLELAGYHRAYELVKRFKTDALKARYKELRSDILSETNIMNQFENFAWAIPSPVLMEDVKRWPAVPGSSVNTIDQIGRWLHQRLEAVDAMVDALPAQEDPAVVIVITKQPEYAVAQVGDTVSFTVAATNVVSYQWQFSNDNGFSWQDSSMTSAKTATLSDYEVTTTRLSYLFRCKLTGSDGAAVYTNVVGITAG